MAKRCDENGWGGVVKFDPVPDVNPPPQPPTSTEALRERLQQLAVLHQSTRCGHSNFSVDVGPMLCNTCADMTVEALTEAASALLAASVREKAMNDAGIVRDSGGTLRCIFNPGKQEVSSWSGDEYKCWQGLFQQVRYLVDEIVRKREQAEAHAAALHSVLSEIMALEHIDGVGGGRIQIVMDYRSQLAQRARAALHAPSDPAASVKEPK